jgi:hypothetical protein
MTIEANIEVHQKALKSPEPAMKSFSQRATKLGQSVFQSQVDAAINVSPSSREFWNKPKNDIREELKTTIANGGDYKALVKEKIWPGPLQTQVLDVANILHHCARYGKIALILPKEGKISKDLLKGLTQLDQTNLARIATVERAFVKEYQNKAKLRTFDQAWSRLIADVAFIKMISLTGKKGFEIAEVNLRKKYGLSKDQTQRRKYLAEAFKHVSNQARTAGFSTEAINSARQSLNLPTSALSSPLKTSKALPGFGAAVTTARILRTAKSKAQEDERRRKKREEERKKRRAERIKAKPKKRKKKKT